MGVSREALQQQREKEEEEHLLSESIDSTPDYASRDLPPTRIYGSRLIPIVMMAFSLFFGAILTATLLRWFSIAQTGQSTSISPGDNYVLDPHWDFDAKPQKREYNWTISDLELNPDGVFRPMIVINEQFPGPLIECNEGDTIVVHVHNQAMNATSIHWHGLYQNGTNWFDGTVGITQCPIAPGTSFTYEFKTSGQSGTYWYHGHRGVQSSDGLIGPFIIHSKDEKTLQQLEYATDRVVMVQDYYYNISSELVMDYLKNNMENAEPTPDGALINGQNIRDCSTVPGRRCDSSQASLATLNLEKGKKHRLRFINVGALAQLQIQLDEHDFAITEVDGTDVVPAYFHRLNILPAQRYSIIVDANVTTESSYWLRARMVQACLGDEKDEMEPEVRAIIRYTTAETPMATLPKSRDWPEVVELECKDMDTSDLHPVMPIAAPPADDLVYLRMSFEIGDWKLDRGFFNTSSWRSSYNTTTLSTFTAGIASGNTSFTSALSKESGVNDQSFDLSHQFTYQTTGIRVVDILISSFNEGAHPLHLHGHKFWLLAEGSGYPPANLTEPGILDLSNPLRRDTATVGPYNWMLLRFVADNPGMWAFHCHMAWHTEAGLMMQFLTRAEEVAKWEVPKEVGDLCAAEGVEKGGRPEDEFWYGTPRLPPEIDSGLL